MKLLLASITAELGRFYEYYESLDRLRLPPNTDKISIHSSSPARNRNEVIKIALKSDYTHIFFTDDDMVYQPDTIMKLLARNVDIVSGMYCMKFSPFPIIAMGTSYVDKTPTFININDDPPGKLVNIDRVPAGCMLVNTNVFRTMNGFILRDKWFAMGQITKDEWGDDLWFCDRAREAGFNIYLDTDVQVGHITKAVLWPTWNNKEWEIEFRINEGSGGS